VAGEWLGGHVELVSIGVLEDARRGGIGTRLLRHLTDGLPHDRWLLMTTADADDPARHLYAREGWETVGPGLSADQVILGRRRPTDS
jgi:ribosomal protein S18 acetylase RimI-like enzyme